VIAAAKSPASPVRIATPNDTGMPSEAPLSRIFIARSVRSSATAAAQSACARSGSPTDLSSTGQLRKMIQIETPMAAPNEMIVMSQRRQVI
jgi:hypothetical protein